jgi:WhiB family redox-sensing transcriptional regulator
VDWRHESECGRKDGDGRNVYDSELWFPVGNTGPAVLQIEEAKAVCRRCDVVETCLRWALDTGQDSGVWGGLSESERRNLQRRKARARRAGADRKAAPPHGEVVDVPGRLVADLVRVFEVDGVTAVDLAEFAPEGGYVEPGTLRDIYRGRRTRVFSSTVERARAAVAGFRESQLVGAP